MSKFSMDIMNKLGNSLEKAGYSETELQQLAQFEDLEGLRLIINGTEKSLVVDHTIDCDADPQLPGGCRVKTHQKGGLYKWDPEKIELYLGPQQSSRNGISCSKLEKIIARKRVLNACVLAYLLKHPSLIPQSWKNKYVCFWGTIFEGIDDCVAALHFDGKKADIRYIRLEHGDSLDAYLWIDPTFDSREPAVIFK